MSGDQSFWEMLHQAREEFKELTDFQTESWAWVKQLEEEGFFIFCYLIEDYNQQILSKESLEESVYTLLMIRKKMLPAQLGEKLGISTREQLQILFSLYERMKRENLLWEDCQKFIDLQLQNYKENRQN